MKRFACLLLLPLAACATTAPCVPSVQIQRVEIPVASRCVDPATIPAEPDVATATGDARNDSALFAAKIKDLRVWGRQLTGMLGACAKP